jgi:hypothetical protein
MPEGSDDQPDGFLSAAILACVTAVPLIYFGPTAPRCGGLFVDPYLTVDVWLAPVRDLFFSGGRM